MRFGSNIVVALLASLALLACKGPRKEAQAPETNPWADYNGTYAPGGPQDEAPAEAKPKSIAQADEPPAAAAASKPTKKSASAKPGKRGAAAPPATVAAAEPDSGSDARSMYGVESGAAAEPEAPAPPPKKTTKKRGAGKKARGKKKQAPK
jgi:hypothetical protein